MKVYLTIDTEVWCNGWEAIDDQFPLAFQRYVYGRSAHGDFALPKTLEILNRFGLTAVFFVSAQKGWAVGHDAQILQTTDAGATWTVQFEDLEREAPLLDIWFQNEQHGLAVGAYGALLETTDGGQNWEDVSDRLDN